MGENSVGSTRTVLTEGEKACCPMRRGMFPNSSSNIRYLLKGILKLYFYKHKEHPIIFIFSHLAKQMPVEIEKIIVPKNNISTHTCVGNTGPLPMCTVSPDHCEFASWWWLLGWRRYQGHHNREELKREQGSLETVDEPSKADKQKQQSAAQHL